MPSVPRNWSRAYRGWRDDEQLKIWVPRKAYSVGGSALKIGVGWVGLGLSIPLYSLSQNGVVSDWKGAVVWYLFFFRTQLPVYQDLLKLGRKGEERCHIYRPWRLLCVLSSIGWMMDGGLVVGNDIRKVVHDGYPVENTITTNSVKVISIASTRNMITHHASRANQPHSGLWLQLFGAWKTFYATVAS